MAEVSCDTVTSNEKLQIDSQNVLHFMASNCLVANPEKTAFMVIPSNTKKHVPVSLQISSDTVEESESEKLLGMTLSNDLRWSTHVYGKGGLLSQLNRRLFTVRRLSRYINRSHLKTIADSLWTSKIRYGLALFGKIRLNEEDPKCKIGRDLQIAQNKLLRTLTGNSLKEKVPTKQMLDKLNMLSVNQMIAQARLLETWKALNIQGSPLSELFQVKQSQHLMTRSVQRGDLTEYGASETFQNNACKLYNKAKASMCSAISYQQAKQQSKLFAKTLPL